MPQVQNVLRLMNAIVILSVIFFMGCSKEMPDGRNNKLHVAVTSVTYADFVSQIGRDEVSVSVLIPPGVDPHDFEPSFNRVKEISDAEVYFRIGEMFSIEDKWIENIKSYNPDVELVDCSMGIDIKNNNPHIWLGIEEAKKIVENIFSALVKLKPEFLEKFTVNKNNFIAEIDSMDKAFTSSTALLSKNKILVYHPAWSYLLSPYGIDEVSIEREGKEPKAKDLRDVIDFARENNIKSIFVEPQFDETSAKAIAAEIGADIITINPVPGNYLENLADVFKKLTENLK